MIGNGIVTGLKPDEIRDMIPADVWVVFDGWTAANSPPKAGSSAMTAEEYRKLVERVDGNHSR